MEHTDAFICQRSAERLLKCIEHFTLISFSSSLRARVSLRRCSLTSKPRLFTYGRVRQSPPPSPPPFFAVFFFTEQNARVIHL